MNALVKCIRDLAEADRQRARATGPRRAPPTQNLQVIRLGGARGRAMRRAA